MIPRDMEALHNHVALVLFNQFALFGGYKKAQHVGDFFFNFCMSASELKLLRNTSSANQPFLVIVILNKL